MGSIRDRIKLFEGMNLDDGNAKTSPKPAASPKLEARQFPPTPAMNTNSPLVVEGLDEEVTASTVTHGSRSENSCSERSSADEASQSQDVPVATPAPIPSSSLHPSFPPSHQPIAESASSQPPPVAESTSSQPHPVLDGLDLYDETATIKKGDTVLYRDRTLGMTEVLVVSVDHALDPPSYVIRHSGGERETERNRLFVFKK